MDDPNIIPDPAEPDPVDVELEPLLGFEPVRRHTRRSDGWPPERQRDFVAALARLGNVDRAAHTIDRTASGAYKVRTSAGAEGFADAWDGALAIYHRRNPKPQRTGRLSRGEMLARPAAAPPSEPARDPDDEERQALEWVDEMFTRYGRKLASERDARLAGRIAEADFYVRQLSFIELVLDLGGHAHRIMNGLKRRDLGVISIVATPMTVLLDRLRRDYWAEAGEPERPPLGELGEHDDEIATGIPGNYNSVREGVDMETWSRRRAEKAALAAEAQAAWEKKARGDARKWRKRVAAEARGPADDMPADDAVPAIRRL